jgi:hypothetical protein
LNEYRQLYRLQPDFRPESRCCHRHNLFFVRNNGCAAGRTGYSHEQRVVGLAQPVVGPEVPFGPSDNLVFSWNSRFAAGMTGTSLKQAMVPVASPVLLPNRTTRLDPRAAILAKEESDWTLGPAFAGVTFGRWRAFAHPRSFEGRAPAPLPLAA